MTFVSAFHFIRPAWLLLLPLMLWIWWLARTAEDPLRGWRAVMDRKLIEALTVGENGGNHFRGGALLVAWLLGIIAIAGPAWRPEPSPFADDPVPVMLVMRADETMDLSDLAPSRMERARLKVADFADERKGQPLGLITFAGTAHLVLPPTRDTAVVATMAAEISPAIMPRSGDDLPGALNLATQILGDAGGAIVVVADTIAADESRLAEFQNDNRLPVHILAVARPDTPELDAIRRAATVLGADATVMTPDLSDVQSLVKGTAKAPVAARVAGAGARWAEAGWWLVPLIALISLASFRRIENKTPQEATS